MVHVVYKDIKTKSFSYLVKNFKVEFIDLFRYMTRVIENEKN